MYTAWESRGHSSNIRKDLKYLSRASKNQCIHHEKAVNNHRILELKGLKNLNSDSKNQCTRCEKALGQKKKKNNDVPTVDKTPNLKWKLIDSTTQKS